MALIKADRVKETSTSTGTGAFTLAGAATGFRRFSAVCAVNDTVFYVIDSDSGSEWETGLGTYSATDTLTRTTVHASSNSNSAVNFSAGTKNVYISQTARQINTISASPPAATGAPARLLDITGAAHTALAGYTEYSDIFLNLARTVQFATGGIGTQRTIRIEPPTYAFAGASGIDDAVTMQIEGGPVAGTNATITRQVGLKIISNTDNCTALGLQLNASQSANLFEVYDSNGTTGNYENLAAISSTGKFTTWKAAPAGYNGDGLGEAFGTSCLADHQSASAFGKGGWGAKAGSTAFGYLASAGGAYSTAIGNEASVFPTVSNSMALGSYASVSTSNTIVLGNSSISSLRCQVQTISALSDQRDKANIRPIQSVLEFVSALKPVQFDWNMRDGAKVGVPDYGFIAQDLVKAQQEQGFDWAELVDQSDQEKLLASYCKLVPILTKAIQELTEKVAVLEGRLA